MDVEILLSGCLQEGNVPILCGGLADACVHFAFVFQVAFVADQNHRYLYKQYHQVGQAPGTTQSHVSTKAELIDLEMLTASQLTSTVGNTYTLLSFFVSEDSVSNGLQSLETSGVGDAVHKDESLKAVECPPKHI